MPKKPTIFQRLDKLVTGNWETATPSTPHINKYDMSQGSDIIYKTTNKDDYEHKKLELQQNKYLQDRWIKANTDLSVTAYAGLNNIKLMYRDADLMDAFPEIGAALDIVSEESCLRGNTEVVLADGESITIEELYSKNYKDFSLLAVDDDGNIQTTLVKGVIWKGKKSLYKITLEDDTEIYCTDDHQWMLSNVDWKETQYMVEGDSLMFIKDNTPAEIGVKNIELTNEIDNVYDLVDSSINSCFAVKTKSGQIISHNCITNSQGKVVNVYSKSDRVKSILEDLFVNRLNIQMTAQMIIRAMCKYGNQYMMLDIDKEKGVKGWKQLPVFNMERIENGIRNPFGGKILSNNKERNDLTTQFVWYDDSQAEVSFRDWQIAHFRLLSNSIYLPYGCIAGDAMIATEEGQKRMDEIQVGDKVWTFNIVTHNNELAEVTMFMPKGKKATYTLRTKDNELKATPDHKFLIYRKNEFVYRELRDIRRGDRVVLKSDKVHPFNKLEKVTCVIRNGENEVYDFTVSNQNSNFFANGIVVHNCSYLNSARRHWRMLSLMEDMMLIYRLERSVERRVYKIFVGAIDDADVQAYVEQIANNFKRTPIIDPLTGQVDLRKNILPVHKDTPIPLLDGRTITIEELAKEFEAGKENYVYSIQDKTLQVVPGKVVWCGKNYTAEELVKITLDDNTYMIMAPEHEIIMRDGSKKRADEVAVGESVMPLYRTVDKNSGKLFDRYEKVYNPNSGKYEFTHRIIANEVVKEDARYNTVHHKDFNKYNNNPSNLVWMDYHEHHKMHGDLARMSWADPIKRKERITKLSQSCLGRVMTEETKKKISDAIKKKYENGEFDKLRQLVAQNISNYNKSEKHRGEARERGLKLGYRDEFKAYNESELHMQHNDVRRKVNIDRWQNEENKRRYMNNMRTKFDSYIWDTIRDSILRGDVKTQNDLVKFINNNLIDYLMEINTCKKIARKKKITKQTVRARILEQGFESFAQYYESIKKNHKIQKIEIVKGDDVYCMTVVGLNGEEDRHNFALSTWNTDGSVNGNGVFVSNCIDNDIFIPVRDQNAPTPIDTLAAGQNMTAIDDIKFVQNKVCTALRIPKTFLNFEEATGDGKNLALLDIRFTRTVNRIQQAFLMELTKVAAIHLYLLGFDDELTNFSLTMNNPSTQAEQLEIDNLAKKLAAVRDAVSDPGNGIPAMSLTRALKEIMKWSEKEIKDNFEEIRLEKGISAELEKTSQIIKKTGVFDTVDRIYGEPGAKYMDDAETGGGQGEMPGGGGGIGGGVGGGFGDGLDALGAPGGEEEGAIGGEEGNMPLGDLAAGGGEPEAPGGEAPAPETPMESFKPKKPLLTENKNLETLFSQYIKKMGNEQRRAKEVKIERSKVYDDSVMINEEFDKMIDSLNKYVKDDD